MGPPDPLHTVLGLIVIVLAWAFRGKGLQLAEANRKIKGLEADLERTKSEPIKWEFRLERYDLLWYPSVTAEPDTKRILAVAPGIPHCKSCIQPLSTTGSRESWVCKQCGARHPESIVDATVTDGITAEALGYFRERHSGYEFAQS